MEKFEFLNQCDYVGNLLAVCVKVLPELSPELQKELAEVLRPFEDFTVPTMWGIGDVDGDSEYDLDDDDKRNILNSFTDNYECKDAEWYAIHSEMMEYVECESISKNEENEEETEAEE